MSKSIKKNYILSMAYQVLTILTPLITTPYVSRVLAPEGIGAVSYTHSIVSYVISIGMLGISAYASRQIAFFQNDREKQSHFFSEVLSLKLLLLFPMLAVYIFLMALLGTYKTLFLIQAGYLIADVVTIDWLFTGNEEFETTVKRNVIVKITSVLLIFWLVKDTDDLLLYAIILMGAQLIGVLLLWPSRKKYVNDLRFTLKNAGKHIKGAFAIFSVQIAGSVYLYLDKTMIGLLSGDIAENGYYEQAQKIVRLSITIITSLSTVMLPRIANAYEEKDYEAINRYMCSSLKFTIFMGIPMMLGLVACSDNVVPWFLGEEFGRCIVLLKIFAPIILLNSIYNTIGYQYLLAVKQERIVTVCVAMGAIINLILNFVLIPRYASVGASIASAFAEFIVVVLMVVLVWRKISFHGLGVYILKCLCGGVVMFVIVRWLSTRMVADMMHSILLLVIGSLSYLMIMGLLGENFVVAQIRAVLKKVCKYFCWYR